MTSKNQLKHIGKFLSFVLRHKPEAIGLTLDPYGWANIDELVNKTSRSDEIKHIDKALIQEVVKSSDKQRFIISEDGEHIRANQGHSIHVDLQLKPVTPPEFLYHGTATRFLDSILEQGLKPQQRQHVHLSANTETAIAVGQRYGKPAVLKIKARLMHEQGFDFLCF
ncbi:RNA 2'-phosphotransferase [Vibrio mangrovi]|uniref:Probable RNA 2'-phosphotransferase n=1 Tax=Vibrio mangrovi TaxID=474394 RepID=A0A1Y6IPT7_9VIBR|nr:RNA 2'-phosphotransferase [Vibrio mangrovi]MDW6003538.1 RNA 2'-phosphotransferase [Vibrio mangrovi]SMR99669.1 RNA 2'-phosphotransferase [Vibrio mangrovi]